jgi:hypothetical protein
MKRRLVNLLTALSLLLCVAVCVLWVRSYRVVDELTYTSDRSRTIVTTAEGGFDLVVQNDDLFRQTRQGWNWRHSSDRGIGRLPWRQSVSSSQNPFAQPPRREPLLGLWWGTLNTAAPYRAAPVSSFIAMGPVWPFALPWAILPALWTVRRIRCARRNRRHARGLCRSCGYDLAGNVSGVCPECGRDVG